MSEDERKSSPPFVAVGRTALVAMALAVLCGGVMVLAGACLPVRLGDPATSEAQPRFNGAWTYKEKTERQLYLVRSYDKRTHLLQHFSYTMDGEEVQPDSASIAKAWLTEIKGQTFGTLDVLEPGHFLGEQEESRIRYVVVRLKLADDRLTVRSVNPNSAPLKDVASAREARQLIARHIDDDAIYLQPLTMKRLGKGGRDHLRKVLAAFHQK
jgi:hypothetical protein